MSNSLLNSLRRLFGTRAPNQSVAQRPKEPLNSQESPAFLDPATLIEADRLRNNGQLDAALSILRDSPFADQAEVARRLGIVLYMKGQVADARPVFEKFLRRNPDDGDALKFLFGCLNAQGERDLALVTARRAVAAMPRDKQLRNALGAILVGAGAIEEAITHFQAALEIDPDDLGPLVNLEIINSRFGAAGLRSISTAYVTELRQKTIAVLSAKLEKGDLPLDEADVLCTLTNNHAETFGIAEDIESSCDGRADLPAGLMINLAIVSQNRGDLGKALEYYRRTETLEPGRTDVRNGLGALYIAEGGSRWLDGWRLVSETYRILNPRNYPVELPHWTGQALGTGRLFVHFDQGVGDALLGLRFLERLAAADISVVLWLPPSMARLVDAFHPFAEIVVSADRPDPRTLGCIYACGLLELIAPLAVPVEEISASRKLDVPDKLVQQWRERLGHLRGKKVGLATMGNPNRADDWLRSVPLHQLVPLTGVRDVSWINFAIDDRAERQGLVEQFGAHDLGPDLTTFADTAAALMQLDLLITIDCSVAHLAGAVGTPFWLFKPAMLDWRWQIGERMCPWWPEARVFAPESPGQWAGAAGLMTALLTAQPFETSALMIPAPDL